jgi:hypothetical protein
VIYILDFDMSKISMMNSLERLLPPPHEQGMLNAKCNAKDEKKAALQDPRNAFRPAHEILGEYLLPRPHRRGMLIQFACNR